MTARVLGALLGQRNIGLAALAMRAGYNTVSVRRTLIGLEHRGWVQNSRLPSTKRGRKPYGYTLSITRQDMHDHYDALARSKVAASFKKAQPW